MDRNTVFTKTAKGITQVNQKSASLSKDLMKVLKLIDGKSNFGQIMEKAELDKPGLEKALNTLAKDGFARVFQIRKEEADPFAEDDFDFTAPGKMPASTQRVIPGAANDISELVRQQEKSDTARKAAQQAQTSAAVRAKEQAEAKARAEAEARARAEAEHKAMEQAQRAKEASERARAELEAKVREENARKAAAAAQQAKLSTEQKAREEEEQRKLAEVRVRAEREAKALAEARSRAEAEAAAMAKARVAADAAAKKQAAEASEAEATMKARMKEEIELRIRSEMEDLLRDEVEDKSRDEMRAQIFEEAKLAARAELEERMHDEREAIHRAEMEARSKAETEQRTRADKESKLRAEAEARAAAATAAAHKAEEEARRIKAEAEAQARQLREQADAAARAREEAEARAREHAAARARETAEVEKRFDAERRAKYEAEARAKIEAEEGERRERELQEEIETERRAKHEAETRARVEARARETIAEDTRAKVQAEIEGDLEKRAEIEGKAQAKAYMQAKAKAERDEDDRMRADQARKAQEIAEILRTKVEPDDVAPEAAPARRARRRRRGSLVKSVFVGLVVVLVLGILALHVIPLRPYAAKLERTMSTWLHDDVSIGSVTFRLVPTPHLNVENVSVGKLLDAKATTGRIYLDIATLFGDRPSISSLELSDVTLSAEAVRRIPSWGRAEGKSVAGEISAIHLHNVKMDTKPALDAFDADLQFVRTGALRMASLHGGAGAWSLILKPTETGFDFDFGARNWPLPIGAPIMVSDAAVKGSIAGSELTVPEFEAKVLEGVVNGTVKANWQSGFHVESDLSVAHVDAKGLMAAFTPDITATGKLDGNFNLTADSQTLDTLLDSPHVQGKFRLVEGSVSNADLVAVMQSDAAGQRAGVTKFAELTGEYAGGDKRASFRNLNLQGGVLRGTGAVDVGANSSLAGHLSLEIRSQVAQDRGAFTVSGTVGRPNIKRGG